MTRVAVVQPALALAEVEANLRRIEDLVRDAHREHSPEVILVPEAMTSPNVYSKRLYSTALPIDGQPFQLLTRLARELDCVVGGGFLSIRGADTYGTYVLAEPDGSAHLHDKDIPSAWENNFYRGGDDDGVTRCGALGATVGLMSGWEWARNRTAARVRAGGAKVVLGGMCWPSFPHNWPGPMRALNASEHERWKRQQHELPGQVARITGVPVAYAAHVGAVTSETPFAPGIPWRTSLIGDSQICDADGRILASLPEEAGEGHIAADIEIGEPRPSAEALDRLWIPDMSPMTKILAWHVMNTHGRIRYRLRHARGGFPWQALPAGDLPDELPASAPAAGPAATS